MGARDRTAHVPQASPQIMRFIEALGAMWERYGSPAGAGRIFGLLLVAERPLTGDEIARTLRVSRSSVSTDIRGLLSLGVVERMRVPGSRAGRYLFSPHAWEHALAMRRAEAGRYRDLAEQAMGELPAGHPGRDRLEELREWAALFARVTDRMLAEWVARRGRAKRGRR